MCNGLKCWKDPYYGNTEKREKAVITQEEDPRRRIVFHSSNRFGTGAISEVWVARKKRGANARLGFLG